MHVQKDSQTDTHALLRSCRGLRKYQALLLFEVEFAVERGQDSHRLETDL